MIGATLPAPPAVSGVDHIGLVVGDADAAADFYVRTLHLPRLSDEVLEGRGARLVWIDAQNVLIQLVEPLGPGPIADFLAAQGEGLHHVCFATPSIPDLLSRLRAETEDGIFGGGRGRRACFLRDRPSGLLVEIYEG
jgi:methylmalonyl-CoA/ethylmalonyl-CoA epimerase